jgi:hypothetical protein
MRRERTRQLKTLVYFYFCCDDRVREDLRVRDDAGAAADAVLVVAVIDVIGIAPLVLLGDTTRTLRIRLIRDVLIGVTSLSSVVLSSPSA